MYDPFELGLILRNEIEFHFLSEIFIRTIFEPVAVMTSIGVVQAENLMEPQTGTGQRSGLNISGLEVQTQRDHHIWILESIPLLKTIPTVAGTKISHQTRKHHQMPRQYPKRIQHSPVNLNRGVTTKANSLVKQNDVKPNVVCEQMPC